MTNRWVRQVARVPRETHEILQDDWFVQVSEAVVRAAKGALRQRVSPSREAEHVVTKIVRLKEAVSEGLAIDESEWIGDFQSTEIHDTLDQIAWICTLPSHTRSDTLRRLIRQIAKYRAGLQRSLPKHAELLRDLRDALDDLELASDREQREFQKLDYSPVYYNNAQREGLFEVEERLQTAREQLTALSETPRSGKLVESLAHQYTVEIGTVQTLIGERLLDQSRPDLSALESEMRSLSEIATGYENTLSSTEGTITDGHMSLATKLADSAKSMWQAAEELKSNARLFAEQQNLFRSTSTRSIPSDELLDFTADGVAQFSPNGQLIRFNSAFSELWSLDADFLMNKPMLGDILDILHDQRALPSVPDYPQWRAAQLSYSLEAGRIYEDEWSLPSGRTILLKKKRTVSGDLFIVYTDVYQRPQITTNPLSVPSAERSTLDHLHEAVVVFSDSGQLQLYNRAFEKVWQLDNGALTQDLEFEHLVELCLPLYDNNQVWKLIGARFGKPRGDGEDHVTGEMRRTDGSLLTYLVKALPDRSTLIAFADVTAMRRVETALRDRADAFEAADRLKTELVRNASYQLRSPLTTIFGYAELLQSERNGALTEAQAEYVGAILSASDHLHQLVANILDLALIEQGRMPLEVEQIDLTELIQQCIDLIASKSEDADVTIRSEIDSNLGYISGDTHRLKQVFAQLLLSSLSFASAGDEIAIIAENSGETVAIKVRDNAKRSSPTERTSAFESLFPDNPNNGISGVALVKHFIRLHGGSVDIKSVDGGGLEVTCLLPKAPKIRDRGLES